MRAKGTVSSMASFRPFDACVTLGRVVLASCPESLTEDTILSVLDHYGIDEALVHENHARTIHPREQGNRRLLDMIAGLPRLHPVWVLDPPHRPGDEAARAVVEPMLEAGVRVARLPMKAAPPLSWLWRDLCRVLETHRVPCFLDFGGLTTLGSLSDTDVEGIRQIAAEHPDLPLIFSHVLGGLGVHPAVVPLMHRMPNLYIDTLGLLEYWREVAREIGPDRVLFATGAPFAEPGIFASNVQYEPGLDDEAKRLIYGDNLRRLIGGVR